LGAERHPCPLEKSDVEADVVSDKNRRPIAKREAGETGYGVLAGGRPGELLVGYTGQSPDGRRQRPPGVGEREKAFTEQGRPIRLQPDANRTDLALASVTRPGESPATPTAAPRRSPTPPPQREGALLSDTRGFIALEGETSPAKIRRETEATAVAPLRGQGFVGAVSRTGRRVA